MTNIKILLFDDVELLDFAGPLEVFGLAGHIGKDRGLHASTVGFKEDITVAKTGLKVTPHERINENDDGIDLFLIPGGRGTRRITGCQSDLEEIDEMIKKSKVVASVCTGALILGKLGYLKDLRVITHRDGMEELQQIDPSVTIDSNQRFIDNGTVLTSAGISAGIDMSLYLVEKYYGTEFRRDIQTHMEYGI